MDLSASELLVSAQAGNRQELSWTLVLESRRILLSQALMRLLAPAGIKQLSDLYALLPQASVTALQTALEVFTRPRTEPDWHAPSALDVRLVFENALPGGYDCHLLPLYDGEQLVMIQAQLTLAPHPAAGLHPQVPGLPLPDPAREEFFNQLAHDVRNALSSVGGFSQLLRRRKLVSGEAESLVERMQQAAENAHQLLQEMLFAREIELCRVRADSLENLIQESLRWFAIQTREKELAFVSEVAQDLPVPAIPAAWFERLLKQLLANALKFTPSGGEIRLAIGVHAGHVQIKVSDTGPGIPAELQSRLFEKVMLRERRAGGMELYLAWQIVQHYAGRIWFETAEGVGSTFYIALPVQ